MIRQDWSTLKKLMFLKTAAGGGSAAVERYANGNPVVFGTDLAKPLKEMLINLLPVQSGSGDPSPQNIRPIVPWNGLTVEHFDENLLTINRTSAQTNQGITYTPIKQDNKTVAVHDTGQRTNTNPFFNLNYTTKQGGGAGISIPPGTYKIFGGTAEVRFQVFYHDANGVERIAGYDDGSGAMVTIPADCTASWCRLLTWVDTPVDTVIYPIIMSTDSVITRYPVTFPSPVYGGTLDVVSGMLTVTHKLVKISSLSWEYQDNWNGRFRGSVRDKDGEQATVVANVYCDCYKSAVGTNSNNNIICGYGKGTGGLIYIKDSRFGTDAEAFVEEMGEHYICYPVVEPQTVTLTPEQITAIKGNNTIWSDANGAINLTYLVSGKYAEDHPVGGLGSGLGSGLLGAGTEPEELIEDPAEEPEE